MQGAVGYFLYIHLTANLPRNLSVKKFLKSFKIWQNYGHESMWPRFFRPPCIYLLARQRRTQPSHNTAWQLIVYGWCDDPLYTWLLPLVAVGDIIPAWAVITVPPAGKLSQYAHISGTSSDFFCKCYPWHTWLIGSRSWRCCDMLHISRFMDDAVLVHNGEKAYSQSDSARGQQDLTARQEYSNWPIRKTLNRERSLLSTIAFAGLNPSACMVGGVA